MTYHVLPIGVTILVIYLFSLYLSTAGFTGRQSHRRFWNWILLGSFLVTAVFRPLYGSEDHLQVGYPLRREAPALAR
ncbi:MAG: hypothetical protein U5L72_18915 [Bacteroidales bacterium]|nr:hypothetical protein [Bacteroidales bacterium]